jgi:Tol biopolymer transport system component
MATRPGGTDAVHRGSGLIRSGRIAFVSTRSGQSEIYVMKVNGTGVTQLTTTAAIDFSPAWAP